MTDGYFDLGDGNRITLADRGTKLPFTPGHEITGSVVAIGKDAEDVKIGDTGIVFPWIGCGICEASQIPHPIHGKTIPVSPILTSSASLPIATTEPVISCPGVKGSFVPLSAKVILLPSPRSK